MHIVSRNMDELEKTALVFVVFSINKFEFASDVFKLRDNYQSNEKKNARTFEKFDNE